MSSLTFDIETRSRIDLRATGVYPYALDCEILCLVYFYKDKYKVYIPTSDFNLKSRLLVDLVEVIHDFDEATTLVAHNANFERTVCNAHKITNNYKIKKWKCTAAKAAYYGLPRSLDGACKALELSVQKDMGGRSTMMKMSRPKADGNYVDDEVLFAALVKYCIADVKATVALDDALPDIPALEANVYALDQLINDKGFPVNTMLSHKLNAWVEKENEELLEEFVKLTDGMVSSPRQVVNSTRWLADNGVKMPNMRAATVEKFLSAKSLSPKARKFLEIRAMLSKSSTAKHKAFINVSIEGVARGTLLYYGASTGRWAGRSIQPQNFPRDVYSEDELELLESLKSKEDAEILLGDSTFKTCSKAIRGVIKAPEGHLLAAADYSAIESRVLAWLVDDHRILKAFRDGIEVYKINASDIFGVDYEDVTKAQRQVGKVSELALGYQGWINAFLSMASNYGIKMSGEGDELRLVEADKLVKDVILNWRNGRPLVKAVWGSFEQGAVDCIRTGQPQKVGKITFRKEVFQKYYALSMSLPSGRKLYYQRVRLTEKEHFGRTKVVIEYSKYALGKFKPTLTYGGQLVENCVQAIARDLLTRAMINGYKLHGLVPNFTVHDEIVHVIPKVNKDNYVKNIETSMCLVPEWATGMPIEVDTNVTRRYGK